MIVCFCFHIFIYFLPNGKSPSFCSTSLWQNKPIVNHITPTHCQPYKCCSGSLRSHSHCHACNRRAMIDHMTIPVLTTYPWTLTVPMTDIVLGTVIFGPKKWPSLRYTCAKSYVIRRHQIYFNYMPLEVRQKPQQLTIEALKSFWKWKM